MSLAHYMSVIGNGEPNHFTYPNFTNSCINGSHDTCAFDNTHDISEAIFEKKHSFKAFFRRLFKEISSKNKYPLGKRIFRLFNVRNTMR